MPVTLDPRLQEIAEREEREKQELATAAEAPVAPVDELTPDSTPETATPEEQNQEQVTETPDPAPVDNRLYIDPARGFYQELTRLEQEHADMRNAIKTRVGRQAAREYKPKIADIEVQLNELRAENARLKTQGLDEDEIKEKLLRDPQFRQQYDASTAQNQGPDPRITATLEARFTDAIEEAEQQNLPPEVIGRYVQAMQGQWYDYERNAQGQPLRPYSPEEGIRKFERDLANATINHFKQKATVPPPPPPAPVASAPAPVVSVPEPAPAPVSKPNQALAQSSPDLTPNSVSRGAGSMSLTDYNIMTPPEKMRLFPEGLQAALDSGKVYAG